MQRDARTMPATSARLARRVLRRIVDIDDGEIAAALVSFAYFFCVLCAYYIVRPVRDEMGVTLGKDGLNALFTIVFLVMLAAVPMFGWVVSVIARRRVVAVVYGFFIASMLMFWLALRVLPASHFVAGCFFVWASVFNLFVISLFWSVMSDIWTTSEAKRLYGFIAAGGSAGAFAGPIVTQVFVTLIGPDNLLPVSAVFLVLAILAAGTVRRDNPMHHQALREAAAATSARETSAKPIAGGILDGAVRVWRSPFLFRIAIVILIANLVSTFFYLEQSRIVGETIADRAARVTLFSRLDLAVNIATVILQMVVTGRVMQHYGVAVAAAALPLVALVGLAALAFAPVLAVIVAVMTAERAVAFSLANPAVKSLYTAVSQEDKYKAQNFIDTVVYRGGDAASGWLFGGLGRDGLGLATGLVAFLTLPLAALWLWLTLDLGRRLEARKPLQSPARQLIQ